MKENIYDDDHFFSQYSQMKRSKEGLSGAGEWHEFQKLLPPFSNKTVLDLGCGYGWHTLYAAQHGAKHVVGVDLSEKMLQIARTKSNSYDNVIYIHSSIENIDFSENSFDVILSSLALHYVEDFNSVCRTAQRILRQDGVFIFSVEHPVFTAYGKQDWYYDDKGNILHWPVDRYFVEGRRESNFLGCEVVKYHKTMTTYLNALWKNGFVIEHFVEPQPSEEMKDLPEMRNEMRRPMMLIVRAVKK